MKIILFDVMLLKMCCLYASFEKRNDDSSSFTTPLIQVFRPWIILYFMVVTFLMFENLCSFLQKYLLEFEVVCPKF